MTNIEALNTPTEEPADGKTEADPAPVDNTAVDAPTDITTHIGASNANNISDMLSQINERPSDKPDDAEPPVPTPFKYNMNREEHEVELPAGISVEPGSEGERWLKDNLGAAGQFRDMDKEARNELIEAVRANTVAQKEPKPVIEPEPEPVERTRFDYLTADQKDAHQSYRTALEDQGVDPIHADDLWAATSLNTETQVNKWAEDNKKEAQAAERTQFDNIRNNAIALHKLDDTLPNPTDNLNATLAALAGEGGYLPWLQQWKAKMGIPEKDEKGRPIPINVDETYNIFLQQTGKTKAKGQKGTKPPGDKLPSNSVNAEDQKALNKQIAADLEGGGGAPAGELDMDEFWLASPKAKTKMMDDNPAYKNAYFARHGMPTPKN